MDLDTMTNLLVVAGYNFIKPEYGVSIYKYMYETQDRGQKVQATAMIAFPVVESGPTIAAPVVLWLHGTCGWSDKCAASKDIMWQIMPAVMSSLGYIVVAPDYIGMNGMPPPSVVPAPYMIGESTAMASLDALREMDVMLSIYSSRLIPENRVIIWGASQGGHATLFTELYAPYYFPELNVIGAVALIPPASAVKWLESVITNFCSGTLYPSFFTVAYSRWYGYFNLLSEVVTSGPPNDFASIIPDLMGKECVIDLHEYTITKSTDIYTGDFVQKVNNGSWTAMQPWYCIFAENSIGLTSVKRESSTPVFYVTAGKDELIPVAGSRAVFDEMCAEGGYQMEYLECMEANHVEGGKWSLPEQLEWVKDRLAGKPLANSCKRTAPICCKASDPGRCE